MLSNGAAAQQLPPPQLRNGSASTASNTRLSEYRHMSTGNLNIGNGQQQIPAPMAGGAARIDGLARSPPSRQNTSHVPCKFFKQGTCQAGPACPFSHDLATTSDNICKYFSKGNCKFGPKCANVHVLPNGQRVNYKNMAIQMGGHLNLGNRVNPDTYHGQSSTLTNAFIRAQVAPPSPFGQYSPFQNQEEFSPISGRQQSIDIAIPTIDTSYAGGSNYGSPRDEDAINRFGLGLSPVAQKGLSALDAPMPASFDSNGISWNARYGEIAASVPAKFGLESPPGSLGAAKDGRTSEALKSLHSSAFGDDTRDRFNGTPASPPGDEYFGKRVMHSQRPAKTKMLSASLPKTVDLDWDSNTFATFAFEEDCLPDTLRDLMTPQEKARRGSRNADEEGRPILSSGTGTPNNDVSSKFGSPSNASPSRWGPYFAQKYEQKQQEENGSRASAFGHVGSPLRNSSLHPGANPSARAIGRPNTSGTSSDSSPYLASPPRHGGMSVISQQLQRTRLSRAESTGSDSGLLPPSVRAASGSISAGRQASSSGRFTTPIDEEQGVFSMEGMEDVDEKKGEKRSSGGWTYAGGTSSPNFGPIGNGKNGTNGTTVTNGKGGLDGMFGGRT